MTLKKSCAVSTLMSVAAALVLFLPVSGAAQTLESADPSAAAPQAILFADGRDDVSFRMTTDASGNFYIAALLDDGVHSNSFAVIKYNVDGKLLGVFRLNNAGIAVTVAVDANGNIYAGGNSPQGGVLVSFTSSGKRRWSKVIGDSVDAVVLDSSGDVYAGGTVNQTSMFVAKFTADGSPLWQTAHQGTTPRPCGFGMLTPGSCLTDMHLDNNGNVIAFGFSTNAGPNTDNTTLKISPQGTLLWVQNFTLQPQFNKVPAAGAVDHDNGIYATGQGVDPFTGARFPYTVKYDTNGNQIFALTGAGNGGSSVAVDPAGNILLGGFTIVDGSPADTASKFDPSGTQIWVTQVPSALKIVTDAEGNVFASGDFYSVTELSPAGKSISTFNGQSQFPGVVVSDSIVDPFGNLLVTGNGFNQNSVMNEIVTLKFPKGLMP